MHAYFLCFTCNFIWNGSGSAFKDFLNMSKEKLSTGTNNVTPNISPPSLQPFLISSHPYIYQITASKAVPMLTCSQPLFFLGILLPCKVCVHPSATGVRILAAAHFHSHFSFASAHCALPLKYKRI
jgi:hypothetical protein